VKEHFMCFVLNMCLWT